MTAATSNGAVPGPQPVDDFDAFWSKHVESRRPRGIIRGIEIVAPYDLPLELAERIEAATPDDNEVVADLLSELYGEGIVDRWKAAGMGGIEFFVVLTWSYMRAGGSDATFEQAFEVAQKAFTDMNTPAVVPNRAEKRAEAKGKGRGGQKGRSGARSSPTSAASTG